MAKRKKPSLNMQGQIILIALVACGVIFTPTTIILLAGMLPTIVVTYLDQTKERVRGITIGAMNLAGCTPSIMELWTTDHTIDNALYILTDPLVWVIMYTAAAAGYCIEWTISGAVSIFAVERANLQVKSIEKEQQELKDRWGEEVSGEIPLDEYGFPLNPELLAKNAKTGHEDD